MSMFVIENNIIKTEEINFDCDALGGVGNVIFNYMKKHGQKVAQIDAATDRSETFESLLQRSIRAAIVLRKRGAIPCSLDPSLSFFEINELIRQVKPKLMFTIPESLRDVKAALKNAELNTEIVVFGPSSNHTEFSHFTEPQDEEMEFKPITINSSAETAIIIFSSGTSGFPKGICLNHNYFIFHSPLIPRAKNNHLDKERMAFEMSKREGLISFLNYGSMYWSSAAIGLFLSAVSGVCRLLCNNFDPKGFWYLIEKYNVKLVKSGKPDDVNTSSLVRLSIGGAALSKKYAFALQELLPDTDIIPTYAQTEVGILAAFQIHNKVHREYYKKNPETVGVPVPGVWYKVVDPETGNILGANEAGELRVKSKTIMNGYYNRDYSNRYDEDGWFRTGDVVKYDENGYFYIVDRLKEMLKYRGWHIPPAILELELSHHPAVKQAVVIGKPHEEDGDHLMAVIVLEEDANDVTAKDIEKYIEERLQDKQRLRGGVKFVHSIPLTPSGKIKRRDKILIIGLNKEIVKSISDFDWIR
ncbi:hypothetical protein NQ314_011098 [Rhamnusium bicolor]|uniref:Uncharacterized protein n=1 Tax=Rhamnusium bicolor TaxID=1586634 RepID=A0AAV8XKF7_9CUCU|nr:hypothetical protein NQ314_011098 [Rhamnusium bicolor]